MSTFIMITRLSPGSMTTPSELGTLMREVRQRIRDNCEGVKWTSSYAVLGPADFLDIFDAPSIQAATRVATIVRTFGHATTEVWPATEWKDFSDILSSLPAGTIEV